MRREDTHEHTRQENPTKQDNKTTRQAPPFVVTLVASVRYIVRELGLGLGLGLVLGIGLGLGLGLGVRG